MDIGYFLKLMTDKNASDMFLTTGAPVHIKVEGKLYGSERSAGRGSAGCHGGSRWIPWQPEETPGTGVREARPPGGKRSGR